MRHLVSFIVVILCSLSVQSFPLPDVIQYSVPSKFFNQNGSKPSSFYDILKQIHFRGGSAAEPTSSSSSLSDHVATTISNEMVDAKNDEPAMTPAADMDTTNSNESPEVNFLLIVAYHFLNSPANYLISSYSFISHSLSLFSSYP
jgi:hypothetical protein